MSSPSSHPHHGANTPQQGAHEQPHGTHGQHHDTHGQRHGTHGLRGRHPAHRRRSLVWLWIGIAVAILLIGGCVILGHSGKPKGPPKNAATPVAAAAVKTGNIDITLNTLGIVTPVYTVTVTSRVAGEITEVRYREGQMVKKDDLLLVIDPRPYAAAVTQAKGQLARDQALLDNARIDLKRYQDAVKAHAVPEQEVATQEALVREDVGTVELDQGNLDAAAVNLDYTQIRAPVAGRVGLRLVDPGNIVAAGGTTALVTITQLQPITVIFNVAEDYLGEITPEIKPGRPLRVDALDRSQQTQIAQGALITLDNQINTATGTVRARAGFPNAKNELFPNQFVNAKLTIKTLTNVALAPTAAIQRNDTAAFVYVIQPNGTVKSQPVTVTATEGDTSAITGVAAGAQLVTDGFDKLQDGSKVTVRRPKPAAGPPAPAGNKTPAAPAPSDGGP